MQWHARIFHSVAPIEAVNGLNHGFHLKNHMDVEFPFNISWEQHTNFLVLVLRHHNRPSSESIVMSHERIGGCDDEPPCLCSIKRLDFSVIFGIFSVSKIASSESRRWLYSHVVLSMRDRDCMYSFGHFQCSTSKSFKSCFRTRQVFGAHGYL